LGGGIYPAEGFSLALDLLLVMGGSPGRGPVLGGPADDINGNCGRLRHTQTEVYSLVYDSCRGNSVVVAAQGLSSQLSSVVGILS
jgi:hypothetical protein